MGHQVRMDVRRIAAVAALSVATAGLCPYAQAGAIQDQAAAQSSSQTSNSSAQSQGESSSSRKGNRKTTHHTTIAEEEASSPDLTKAEDLIQKKNYAEAEPLLHKVVE